MRKETKKHMTKYSRPLNVGKLLPTIPAKPVGVWAVSQRLIPTGEGSGLLTRIAATESVSLWVRMKS
jgi:hypothetical protein